MAVEGVAAEDGGALKVRHWIGPTVLTLAILVVLVLAAGLPWGPVLRAGWIAPLPTSGTFRLSGALEGPPERPSLCSTFTETLPVSCSGAAFRVVGLRRDEALELMDKPVPLHVFVGRVRGDEFLVSSVENRRP